jgi:site-specific recombinase XerD
MNGVPIETISKMLGHTKITTTMIYAQVNPSKIRIDMDTLQEKLDGNQTDTTENK